LTINILSTLDLSAASAELKLIKKISNFKFSFNSRIKTLRLLEDVNIYISSAAIKVDQEFLKYAKNLKFIFSPSTGTDHIDLKELKKRNVKLITIAKNYSLLKQFTSTSELSFALLLLLIRNLNSACKDVKNGNWGREKFTGNQLYKKTLGIVGYGRLGRISAKIAKGFSMNIVANDVIKKKNNIKFVSLNKLLKLSDFIFIHVHLNKNTVNLINKNNIRFMKRSAILINTSRGKIINELDLLNALKSKRIRAAGLDVIDGEWLDKRKLLKHPLIKYMKKNNNLIIVPHIGGSSVESINGARIFIMKKLLKLLKKLNEFN
jgi:phosphoglycerate dehydrogenase-like enzyme